MNNLIWLLWSVFIGLSFGIIWESCFMRKAKKEALTDKEKAFLLDLLYKCDWTQTQIADEIIRKLELNKKS